MNIYTINIIVDTKYREGRVYEKVSINKYPIIITGETQDSIINNIELWKAIKNMFIDESVYNTADFYIRTIDEDFNITEFIIPLKTIKKFDEL